MSDLRKADGDNLVAVYERMFDTFYDRTHFVPSIRDWSVVKAVVQAGGHRDPLVIADFGCGTGRYILPILRYLSGALQHNALLAVDIAPSVPNRVVKRLRCTDIPFETMSEYSLKCGNTGVYFFNATESARSSLKIGFHEYYGRIDVAFSFLSYLSHLQSYDDRVTELARIAQSLRPGGVVILTLPNSNQRYVSAQHRVIEQRRKTADDRTETGDALINPFHLDASAPEELTKLFCHAFPLDEVTSLLVDSGLSVCGHVRAAKRVIGYRHLEPNEAAIARNLADARSCMAISEHNVEIGAQDFLVVAIKPCHAEDTTASRRHKISQLIDRISEYSIRDAVRVIMWQAAHFNRQYEDGV